MNNDRSDYFEFMPAAVASMNRPPSIFARLVTWTIFIFVLITLAWLYLAKVDIIVTAQGKIIPAGKVKLIQSAEGGVVKNIFVSDGQHVGQGDPLIELDQTTSDADEEQLSLKLRKTQITVNRIQAELAGENKLDKGVVSDSLHRIEQRLLEKRNAAFNRQSERLRNEYEEVQALLIRSRHESEKLKTELAHKQQQLSKKRRQAKKGLIAKQEVVDAKFEIEVLHHETDVAKSTIFESMMKLATAKKKKDGADEEHARDLLKELSDAQTELESTRQDLIKAKARIDNLILRSPVSGVVQQLALNTIGGVVSVAEKLMVIVPAGAALEMEAQILNKDIGFVDLDQPTRVKVNAFEYTRYGSIAGDIAWIASDAVVDEKKGPVYPVRIALESTTLPKKVNNRVAMVLSGMNATADIVIGERRLIQYFLGTIMRYKDESLNER